MSQQHFDHRFFHLTAAVRLYLHLMGVLRESDQHSPRPHPFSAGGRAGGGLRRPGVRREGALHGETKDCRRGDSGRDGEPAGDLV